VYNIDNLLRILASKLLYTLDDCMVLSFLDTEHSVSRQTSLHPLFHRKKLLKRRSKVSAGVMKQYN
jgi:hypothetical protein